MSADPTSELPFKRLGEYDVLARISQGGMATVYVGRSRGRTDQFVALKVIRTEHCRNEDFVAMFLDEGRIASRLSHPNIVNIHELGLDGRRHYLVMELLRGRTLLEMWEALQARGTRMPWEASAWVGARIADALHHAHELKDEKGVPQRIVHRDLDPSNVFLTYEGVPKIIDFGLAKARNRIASTAAGIVKGKLAYLSPEQTSGSADRRADIFALGVTLWEMTVGRRLFKEDDDVATLRRVQAANVPDPTTLIPGYPKQLAQVLARALARDPGARYATAKDFCAALDACVLKSGRSVDERTLRSIVAELFPAAQAPGWERLIPAVADGSRAGPALSDDTDECIEGAKPSNPPPFGRAELDAAVVERLEVLSERADTIGAARAHLERAVVDELLGDGSRAAEYAEMSVQAAPTSVAHAMLRRLQHARGAESVLLQHLDAEIAACTPGGARADLLAERARLFEAAAEGPDLVIAAWECALAADPEHPAALKGLEGALGANLTRDSDAPARVVAHLARMAQAYASQGKLAAWLHVDRARILDRVLGQVDAARAALLSALELDPGLGPVRAACVRHAVAHRDAEWLVALLAGEAELEPDIGRAARLELDAASIARHRLGDLDRAIALLERGAARAPTSAAVDRGLLDALVTLHGAAGHASDTLRVRRLRLALLEDPRGRAEELRAIALLEESMGDRDRAIEDIERARALVPDDPTLAEELDRLLSEGSLHDRRIDLWAEEAARAEAGPERARLLARAAALADSLGEPTQAIEHFRAALISSPGHAEAVDGLTRLLVTSPSAAMASEVRDRINVYAHAAEHAGEPARRIAYLEAVALLQEEMLGDSALASATYEAILRLEPSRRSAVLGLARTAARSRDGAKLARALLEEASATGDAVARDDIHVRAAAALAATDGERAFAIVREVLARHPAHAEARRVEQRLHEAAGRWALVEQSIAARIVHATRAQEKLGLWLSRAELQSTRLHAPRNALVSMRAALALDPDHPAIRHGIVSLLENLGDARALRDGLVELAAIVHAPEERARFLVRAAELDELVLLDDEHAEDLCTWALECAPAEEWIAERRVRVLERRSRQTGARELQAALAAQLARAPENSERALDLALALLDGAGDRTRATSLVDSALTSARAAEKEAPEAAVGKGKEAAALRTLERIAREISSVPLLANALAQQADAFDADAPRLGALWAEAAIVEWKLPGGDASGLIERIRQRAPKDRAALDAAVRYALPKARVGDRKARERLLSSLRELLAQASDESAQVVTRISLALVIELHGTTVPEEVKEALQHYREALRIDPQSVVAAAGLARLAEALGDEEAGVAAAVARAALARDGETRAQFLVHAAGQLRSAKDVRLGSPAMRRAHAMDLLEQALAADPEALSAVRLLAAMAAEHDARDRLLTALRTAFERARASAAVVLLGTEIARLASFEPPDRVLAATALRRVLEAEPDHVPTLRTLSDLCVAQRSWGEAVQALESLVSSAQDPRVKLRALSDLAELYGRRLKRPADVERVLTHMLDVDPANVRALSDLVRQRRAGGAGTDEIASLLARLAEAEPASDAKGTVLTELADLHLAAGDRPAAERSMVEALALTSRAPLLTRLLDLHAGKPAEQARALLAVVVRAQEIERPDASCFAMLGQLEVLLGRFVEGIAHLRVAIALAPALHEARAALAAGLAHTHCGTEAANLLLTMVVPDPAPLLHLHDAGAALATLEHGFASDGRGEQGIVARELRAIAGGLDDGSHVELRARRIARRPAALAPMVVDGVGLRASIGATAAENLLFDLALALIGAEGKLARTDLAEFGVSRRDALTAATGHPLAISVQRLARMLDIAAPELVLSDQVGAARVAMVEGVPWILASEALAGQPEPLQIVELARAMTRIALAFPWLDELPSAYAHAVLCGAARQVLPQYAAELRDANQQELIDEYAHRIGRAIGRRQKKLLAELAPKLSTTPPATLADVDALAETIARAELRVGFLVTGDLLATFDHLRSVDATFARETSSIGPRALAATLTHRLAGDTASFALSPAATVLRWRAGTLWGNHENRSSIPPR